MKKKTKSLFKSSPGAASTILLILGIVVVIAIILIFVILRNNVVKTATDKPVVQSETNNEPPKPVYETTIGEVRFIVQKTENRGSVMVPPIGGQKNVTTTDTFIKVTLAAQNKGKLNLPQESWKIGNIIDSEGRNYINVDKKAFYFLPNPNLCGSLLKPEFEPTQCIKFYEVSKESKGLKIQVTATDATGKHGKTELLDLKPTL